LRKIQRNKVEIEVNKGMMEYLRKEVEKMGLLTRTQYFGHKDQIDFDISYGFSLTDEEESGFAGTFLIYIKNDSICWFDVTHYNSKYFISFEGYGTNKIPISSSADKECVQKSAKYIHDISNKIYEIGVGREIKEYGL
jgi:hypothetical protein